MLSDTVGRQVAVWRKRRELSRQELADECARRGMPKLTVDSVANIESGRRQAGVRQRTITVDELTVLAHALSVPPVLLACPVMEQPTVELLPGSAPVPSWSALTWFTGDGVYVHETLPTNLQEYDDAIYPITLLRFHSHLLMMRKDAISETGQLSKIIEKSSGDEATFLLKRQEHLFSRLETLTQDIIALRQQMRQRGIPLPPLPPEMAHVTDSPSKWGNPTGALRTDYPAGKGNEK